MRISNRPKFDFRIDQRKIPKILFHLLFFITRNIVFSILYFISYRNNPKVITVRIEVENATYLAILNTFTLYLFIKSIAIGNVYKYYLCVILLFNNSVITMIVPLLEIDKIFNIFWQGYTIMSSVYLLEFIISVYWLYLERNENKYELFKQIGIDPKINNAFEARKKLETLCEINVFMTTLVQRKLWLPYTRNTKWFAAVKFIDTIFTYIQQLFISINFNEENPTQRKIAIGLSITNIFFPTWLFVLEVLLSTRTYLIQTDFHKFIYLDIVLIAIFMTIFLINDYSQFGSGLKEYMNMKTVRLHLSSEHECASVRIGNA